MGVFSGLAPVPGEPESPDGRFRILNVPSVGSVVVYERGYRYPVAATISAADGTWVVDRLNADRYYTVIGVDGAGRQNAAIQDWVKPYVPE